MYGLDSRHFGTTGKCKHEEPYKGGQTAYLRTCYGGWNRTLAQHQSFCLKTCKTVYNSSPKTSLPYNEYHDRSLVSKKSAVPSAPKEQGTSNLSLAPNMMGKELVLGNGQRFGSAFFEPSNGPCKNPLTSTMIPTSQLWVSLSHRNDSWNSILSRSGQNCQAAKIPFPNLVHWFPPLVGWSGWPNTDISRTASGHFACFDTDLVNFHNQQLSQEQKAEDA